MIQKVAGTAFTRLITGFILLGVLALQTKHLGLEIMSDITLFRIALTFNNLLAAIYCGPVLVFLGNRHKLHELVFPAFSWILTTSLVVTGIQYLAGNYPHAYTPELIICSVLFALQVFYENILLSREKITAYNISGIIHHALLIGVTVFFIFYHPLISAYNYIYALMAALAVNVTYLFIVSFTSIEYMRIRFSADLFVRIFTLGFTAQLTNFIQTLNYRVSVLILARYWSKKSVGYFGACLQLAEAVWIVARSLAVVQYARISGVTDRNYQLRLTFAFSKISFVLTLLAGGFLLLLPGEVYASVFGVDFNSIRTTLLYLLPGVICFSLVLAYSNFFSGRGNFRMNLVASALSLFVIICGGFIFIPPGDVLAASCVYSSGLLFMLVFYVLVFMVKEKVHFRQFLPESSDYQFIITAIKERDAI